MSGPEKRKLYDFVIQHIFETSRSWKEISNRLFIFLKTGLEIE